MEFKRITRTDDPLYERAIALYHISFPAHEQREALSQAQILNQSAYHFDVICDNGEFIGEILYWDIGGCFYIEHFCIEPEMRNRRYGQKILSALQTTPLILEIDPPIDAISLRRKHFYERCGFVENPLSARAAALSSRRRRTRAGRNERTAHAFGKGICTF